jgi:hypothetical protein
MKALLHPNNMESRRILGPLYLPGSDFSVLYRSYPLCSWVSPRPGKNARAVSSAATAILSGLDARNSIRNLQASDQRLLARRGDHSPNAGAACLLPLPSRNIAEHATKTRMTGHDEDEKQKMAVQHNPWKTNVVILTRYAV